VTEFCLIFAGDGGGGVVVHVFSVDVDCHAGFNFPSFFDFSELKVRRCE